MTQASRYRAQNSQNSVRIKMMQKWLTLAPKYSRIQMESTVIKQLTNTWKQARNWMERIQMRSVSAARINSKKWAFKNTHQIWLILIQIKSRKMIPDTKLLLKMLTSQNQMDSQIRMIVQTESPRSRIRASPPLLTEDSNATRTYIIFNCKLSHPLFPFIKTISETSRAQNTNWSRRIILWWMTIPRNKMGSNHHHSTDHRGTKGTIPCNKITIFLLNRFKIERVPSWTRKVSIPYFYNKYRIT